MTTITFNDGWTVGPQTSAFAKLSSRGPITEVTLPHDALIGAERAPEHRGQGAFFPSASFQYSKTFDAPEAWRGKHVTLHFDGAYRDAMVFVNDGLAANRANGYVPFDAVLDPFLRFGESNTVRVDVRTHDDSRWYAGAGLYRDVRLSVREPVHIRTSELHATTPVVDDDLAVVEVAFPVDNLSGETRTLAASVRLQAPDGSHAAQVAAPVTILARSSSVVRLRLYVPSPQLWSVDSPHLYTAVVALADGDATIDETELRVGVRTLRLDPRHGLRINGTGVKLRGACIHHDNGPLGVAAFADAEHRKIRLLKDAGFNAIRSSHNPLSEAMLHACDEIGMLVMDETFDMWTMQKSSFDYSVSFPEWWERDVEAMVLRDRNHPSVIFYSIGNEIAETGNPFGAQLGRQLAEKVRSLDPDRFVTNGINGFVSVIDDLIRMMTDRAAAAAAASDAAAEGSSSGSAFGGINDAMSSDAEADRMNQLSRSSLVTMRTEESFSVLDVAGMNYGDARYELDAEERPERILVGSETFPSKIASNWALVEQHPQVIGDFTWTGWDYIGEVGIGRPKYDGEQLDLESPYPWLLAWCGDIDITGFRRPASYFREIVFGLRDAPYIAVRNPADGHRTQFSGAWAWTDSQGTWTWDAPEGTRVIVEVYSADDEVELLLDGRSLGRQPAGPEHNHTALFDVEYRPGELVAVAYRDGAESGRSSIVSRSGDARLSIQPEEGTVTTGPGSLVYVPIELVDDAGTVVTTEEPAVTVTVEGPAVLQALGSARPDNEEPFTRTSHRAFRGRVLAILRPTGPGAVRVTAAAEGFADVEALVEVTA